MDKPETASMDTWNEFLDEIQMEMNQVKRSVDEITLMLDQSHTELIKLTQKNQVVSAHLQQVQMHFDTIPAMDIKTAYQAVMESQQRLLVLRAQVEKLKSDQSGLQKLYSFLERTQKIIIDFVNQKKENQGDGKMELLESMINSQETVRQRLSNQMHDGPAQALSNFIIRVEIANRLLDLDINKAKDELNYLKTEAAQTFSNIKSFILELRPMALDDLGLLPTLKKYIDNFITQNNIDVNLKVSGQERKLQPFLEVMLFRAIQELLTNSLKHNQSHPVRVTINVAVEFEESSIKVTVSDNGIGFGMDQLEQTKGLGLKLIHERVNMLGGSMEINAFTGQGCNVSLIVPCLGAEKFDRVPSGLN